MLTMWTIGLVSVFPIIAAQEFMYSQDKINFLFFAPMIGTIVAEIVGHFFNDYLATSYIRSHQGRFLPEHRLWAVYPSCLIGMGGLILFGQAIDKQLSWVAVAFAWGMNTYSTLTSTTAISAYFVDVLPHHTALTASWLNCFRTIGKLISPPFF
jgi:hypothetical protein